MNSKGVGYPIESGAMNESISNEEGKSTTATAILNILQNISISPPNSSNDKTLLGFPYNSVNSGSSLGRSPIQHHHSLPKSIIPKRRLSSSGSFDGFGSINSDNSNTTNNTNNNIHHLHHHHNHHKKHLVYLRGYNKVPTVRAIASPLSRSFLIKRLNTFSVFNWSISDSALSPLICATQGWKCHPVRKNELHCTSCHSGMIVKVPEIPEVVNTKTTTIFNNQHHADNYDNILNNTEGYDSPFEFKFLEDDLDDNDISDNLHVYETILNSYVNRLSTDHYSSCAFLSLLPLFPKDQNYYLSVKDISREVPKFNNRLSLLQEHKEVLIGKNFQTQILEQDEIEFLRGYLKEFSKRNNTQRDSTIEMDVDTDDSLPSLDVILPALLGWELKVQTFHNDTFMLLKCECCTRRILLNTCNREATVKTKIEELKPCPHRAEIPAREQRTEFDEATKINDFGGYGGGYEGYDEYEYEDEDEERTHLEQEHDSWCCMRKGWRIVLEGLRSI